MYIHLQVSHCIFGDLPVLLSWEKGPLGSAFLWNPYHLFLKEVEVLDSGMYKGNTKDEEGKKSVMELNTFLTLSEEKILIASALHATSPQEKSCVL